MNNNYLTVTQINKYIKSKFDNDPELGLVYLKGELSNFKAHSTGHLYFTVKDENSRILAVMFANNARLLKFNPSDGDKVLIIGRINVYEANGNYQIYVQEMIQDGIGNLYLEFEKLKKKLNEKGYFDLNIKKAIPKFSKKIGVITASTGAAIRDIITTINRRYRLAEIILFPSLVQGAGAKEDIVKNLNLADTYGLDVIILGRGGGSIEDLWAFNEEIVADAIYNAKTPIISAVGHEVDFTISDFAADLRAATPTAAAELAVPDSKELLSLINNNKLRVSKTVIDRIRHDATLLNKLANSYVLKNPMNMYEVKIQKLDNLLTRIINSTDKKLEFNKNKYLYLINRLEPLNPILTLKRGYAIAEKDDIPLTSVKKIKKNDLIKLRLSDGYINTRVLEVKDNG